MLPTKKLDKQNMRKHTQREESSSLFTYLANMLENKTKKTLIFLYPYQMTELFQDSMD